MKQPTTKQNKLSAEELKFSRLVATGYSLTAAYSKAFPNSSELTYNTRRQYACQLYAKSDISLEVETVKKKRAMLARLAEDRIEETLTSGKSGKSTNEVAMFMYDHANGKATQKVEQSGVFVNMTYDLSGGDGGEVPKEVLQELEDDDVVDIDTTQ